MVSSSIDYQFANISIRVLEKDNGDPLPEIESFRTFRTRNKPKYRFEFIRGEPFRKETSLETAFAGQYWKLFRLERQRCFYICNPKQPDFYHYILMDSPLNRGEVYCNHNDLNINLQNFFHRPLKILLSDMFALQKGVFIHATGIIFNKQAIVFTGYSEAGKSTLARLWMKVPGVEILSDERILILEQNQQIWAYGTPWFSSAMQSSPVGAPLKKVFIIHHSPRNEARQLKPVEASTRIFQNAFPARWDKELLTANLDLIRQISIDVPCFEFGFLPDDSAIEFLLCHR